ncbi:hypothetical protein KIN20_036915 [Parelaphostrongylus tenuis]|uniref:Uncharacterized protein n=1 Tax=Parelaphostrongylus tenuis TaxID=148309 RepID=A0AAD5RD79_PARTN|nr:hypothetical protein KIN20_036915 [Parelaphostrongylus tenuis]
MGQPYSWQIDETNCTVSATRIYLFSRTTTYTFSCVALLHLIIHHIRLGRFRDAARYDNMKSNTGNLLRND